MLDPIKLDNVVVSESNAEDFILLSHTVTGYQLGFIHRDEVIALQVWLSTWIANHS